MTSATTAETPEQIVGDLIDAVVPTDQHMLEVRHVAKVLGVTDRAVLYLLQDRKLGFIRTGKRGYRIPRVILTEYMMRNFVARELTEAEQRLAATRKALQMAERQLAKLNARIEEAELALRDEESPPKGRSTQTVLVP
ncbi:excisionase family DNA binding protein [Nonomuraea fuscirosea]|uniref:Excisionase family DNA binding protein n=1 Tax=Nonomuraea fuscirosea TaxID=1291556 RepID=A0A2T0N2E7_9ACTN|nr:excisionase family DNA-binding protein [Nonomuraea fuscirosea]PRX66160.1 excisionase family DNA binding protein [Nonomuraea fuscirosea]